MKTLREYIDILDEISRRDFLKGAGAAAAGAALGMPKDAEADRTWSTDPVSDKWRASMTSENYPGAYLFWDEDRNIIQIELTSPTNLSPAAIKEKRLHFPKITNASYMLRLGNSRPISGKGIIGTVAARDFGNYRHGALILTDDKNKMSKIRDEFINADKVAVRLEIDGTPTSIVFHENPYLLQQRQQRQQQQQQQQQQQKQQQSSDAELDQLRTDFKASLQRFDQEREKYRKESQSLEESEPEDSISKIDRLFRDA